MFVVVRVFFASCFFFIDPVAHEIYTLSLHDALPISVAVGVIAPVASQNVKPPKGFVALYNGKDLTGWRGGDTFDHRDRKSTRLNSSHLGISYAVFCLKKKNKNKTKKHH